MAEMIMTRSDVLAEAMQFVGTQANVDEIQEWINNYNGNVVLTWNGRETERSGDVELKGYPGQLEIYHDGTSDRTPDEAMPGDWIVKSSRDTFYTVQKQDFEEIWVVMH